MEQVRQCLIDLLVEYVGRGVKVVVGVTSEVGKTAETGGTSWRSGRVGSRRNGRQRRCSRGRIIAKHG